MDGLVVDTIELAVSDGDVVDGIGQFGVFLTHNHHAVFRLLTGNILHRHIADGGVETTTAHLTWLVVGVELEYGLATLTNGHVTHVDILDDTTTAAVGLDTQHALQLWRIHHTIVGIHILTTARNL